jgi:hypothetical protein
MPHQHPLHEAYLFLRLSLVIFFIAFIPAGPCGALGSIYLILRTKHIGLGRRMFDEAAVLGAVLSIFCPALMWLFSARGVVSGLYFLFFLIVGIPVALLYAAYFRRSMLSTVSPPTPISTRESNITQP